MLSNWKLLIISLSSLLKLSILISFPWSILKTNDKKNKAEHEILLKIKSELDQGKLINIESFNKDERLIIRSFQLLSTKPTFYIANISDDRSSDDALNKLIEFANLSGNIVIPTSIKIEQEIAILDEEERKEYLELMDMDEPVLNKIIFKGYELLGLQIYFTAGPQEIRAWTGPCSYFLRPSSKIYLKTK